ncbi:glycosyltransferase [Sphingobium sp. HWE2-09]|uniref:glycosyltransferase n=1 Tax=Sphingobium sp. HWE2-09 TaxID=3108390 RepID=UPI002DC8C0FC|nr:glycosyltransferase [Sphingobium sp. HWE2-09]
MIEAVTSAGYRRPVGLVIMGDGRDRRSVRRAAANNPHICLLAPTGNRSSLAETLASTDALVHGCEAETFCMVAAEARASGLPVIVPDSGGAADQAMPGTGLHYRAGQSSDLARVVSEFLNSDPTAYRQRALQGAADVTTMDDHFDRLFDVYAQFEGMRRHAA